MYFFGVTQPGFFGIVQVDTKKSILFMPRLPEEYAVWMGKLLTPADVKAQYAVDEVYYVDEVRVQRTCYSWRGLSLDGY